MPKLSHQSEISQVQWLCENTLLTIDSSGYAKIWNYSSQECIYTLPGTVKQVRYSQSQKLIAFTDTEGGLHSLSKDFGVDKMLASVERKMSNNLDISKGNRFLNSQVNF